MQRETRPSPTRRAVLVAGVSGAGVVAVAACSSRNAGGDGSGQQPKRNTPVAKLTEVDVGTAIDATLADGAPVIVARPDAQQVVCFSAICTHQGCVVAPSGTTLNCPCHGSQFDALTGKVLHGPATRPLPKIGVTVRNGEVVTT
jgi:cytochrome b6-f complex iron-sulfur subunit